MNSVWNAAFPRGGDREDDSKRGDRIGPVGREGDGVCTSLGDVTIFGNASGFSR